LVILQRCP